MSDLHLHHGSAYDGADRLGGAVFWFAFGFITAVVALFVDIVIDGVVIGAVQVISDVEACGVGFGDSLLVVILGAAMLSSVVVGYAILRMRAQVGAKAEAHDLRWARHLRRWYTASALGLFVVASPLKWLMILGMAYC